MYGGAGGVLVAGERQQASEPASLWGAQAILGCTTDSVEEIPDRAGMVVEDGTDGSGGLHFSAFFFLRCFAVHCMACPVLLAS